MKHAKAKVFDPPDLVNALYVGLHEWNEREKKSWDEYALHASDLGVAIGEGCARQPWLRVRGAKEADTTAGEDLMFDHGLRIQDRVEKLLRLGLKKVDPDWHVYRTNVRVDEAAPDDVAAELDFELRHKPTGTILIVDCKSLRGRAFGWLAEGGKPGHRLQVQCYMMKRNADMGMLLYVDREGQNHARQFAVERNDAAVIAARDALKAILAQPEMPPLLEPEVTIRENKGDDSVYLDMPWNCHYCGFLDISCPGALTPNQRALTVNEETGRGVIVAKISKKDPNLPRQEAVYATKGCESLLLLVKRNINVGGTEDETQ